MGAVLSALTCVPPAEADVVSLAALEQRALQNRPELAAGSALTRAARAELAQAQSAYYPTLSLGAQSSVGPGRELFEIDGDRDPDEEDIVLVQGVRDIDDGRAAFRPSVRSELDLELKSSLYDFGRTRAAVEAGRAQHASAQAEEDAARRSIVLAVRSAYLAWLGQSELLAIAQEAATDAERRSQRVQSLIDEGARPKAELSVARAEEMLARLEFERARGALRKARLGVEHTVGSRLPPAAEPDRALLQAPTAAQTPGETEGDGDDAALRALALKQRAASADARRLDRADAPVLAGALSAGVRAQDEDVFPAYAVGLNFSVPLLDGGGADAGADAARARADAIAAELHAERVRQRNERARAELDRDNARAQLETASALLQVVTQRVSEAEQGYELGASGLEPVTQARALLRRAQTEVVHARLAQAEAALRLTPR